MRRLAENFEPFGTADVPQDVVNAVDLIRELDREERISSVETFFLLAGILKRRKSDKIEPGFLNEPAWISPRVEQPTLTSPPTSPGGVDEQQ